MTNKAREVRAAAFGVEVRKDDGGGGLVKVEGLAASFGEVTRILDFSEVIAPGAFDASLARQDDVLFQVEHVGLPLARSTSGTLRLSVEERGLMIAADLDPSDPDAARIIPKLRRGDLSKMSFGFIAIRDEWDSSGPVTIRTLHEVQLLDVSVVTFPAYEGTDIALRSRSAAQLGAEGGAAARAADHVASMSARLRLIGA